MKRSLLAGLILCCAGLAVGQSPTRTFPDVTTAQTNASIALLSYKGQVETFLIQDGTDIANLQVTVGAPTTGLLDRMTAAEARLTKLENPTPPPPPTTTVVTLTGFPTAPLAGIFQNVDWGTGMWAMTPQGIQPAVLGQPRSFVLPATTTLVNIQLECLTTNCIVTLTDSVSETVTNGPNPLQAGNVIVLNTGWSKVSGKVTLSTASTPATDVRILSLSWN
jgi:hypothetical protein